MAGEELHWGDKIYWLTSIELIDMETDIYFNRIFTFLHAENELKSQQKNTEISREYPILVRVTVSWMHQIK